MWIVVVALQARTVHDLYLVVLMPVMLLDAVWARGSLPTGVASLIAEGGIRFADKPDIPFKLLGYTDLSEQDFVYFKTAGGHWVGAAEDDMGRLFMIDEVHAACMVIQLSFFSCLHVHA